MSDPSFLLSSSAAKDLTEYARDLQAMVDVRASALEQPLSGLDFDISGFGEEEPPQRVDH
jgi:hypothetical protein